jgi:hypothetical protein
LGGTEIDMSDVFHEDFGDGDQMLNMRNWLEQALVAHGAVFDGGGCGMGEADIDILVQGMRFNVRIKPLLTPNA